MYESILKDGSPFFDSWLDNARGRCIRVICLEETRHSEFGQY